MTNRNNNIFNYVMFFAFATVAMLASIIVLGGLVAVLVV
jgi:hypothetical protein